MPKAWMLGLFHEATPTATAIDHLRGLSISDEQITVLSGMPFRPEIFGRPHYRGRVGRLALLGAFLGLLFGLFLSAGIWLLYPLAQGGQPLVPVPPMLIVLFEATMLGMMWAAFFSLLIENRFPIVKSQLYDPRITEGHIGVLVEADERLSLQVEKLLNANGAHHFQRIIEPERLLEPRRGTWRDAGTDFLSALRGPDPGHRGFWLSVLGIVTLLGIVSMLFAYNLIPFPFPTQMENQVSIAYEQGPRLAAPAAAIPVQGPVLAADQPASEPIPVSPDSLQRGLVLYGVTCIICHGPTGTGSGTLSSFFNPKPADFTSAPIQGLEDDTLFLVVTQGFGLMPSIAENLGVQERWDVINYVRSFKK